MKGSHAALLKPEGNAPAFQTDRAWIELDMSSLRHNISVLRSLLPQHYQLMPVIKADAYGHGAVAIARELNACGIRAFCIASVSEGVMIREHGINGEILVMGYTHPNQFYLLKKYRLTQAVIDSTYAKTLNRYGERLHVHIKIDTGMRRLGVRSENMNEIIEVLNYKNLIITGIFTHLCVADGSLPQEMEFTQKQIERFSGTLLEIERHGFKRPKTHVQNSYALLKHHVTGFDCARVGTSIYGMLYTSADTQDYAMPLRPVLSLKARVCAVKTLFAGESLGYGLAFTASRDMRFAILTIGYGDGIPRSLSCGVGHVLINGQKAPVIGRICMDQMMVDVTQIGNVGQGDIAVMIGKSGTLEITVCDIAEQTGTITPEILCRLGARLERVVCGR